MCPEWMVTDVLGKDLLELVGRVGIEPTTN
jgi:hypothetical protein